MALEYLSRGGPRPLSPAPATTLRATGLRSAAQRPCAVVSEARSSPTSITRGSIVEMLKSSDLILCSNSSHRNGASTLA